MKTVNCRDLGVDCDFQARGNTTEEIMQKCADHAKTAHGMKEIPAELQARVRKAIKDVPEQKRHGA